MDELIETMTSSGQRESVTGLIRRRVVDILGAIVRGAWEWPGIGVCVVAYAITAVGLYAYSAHPYLWGFLAAVVVGVLWYLSPVRAWEVSRRERIRSRR